MVTPAAARRRWLRAAAALPAGALLLRVSDVLAQGRGVAQGVRQVTGEASINGSPARVGQRVRGGDVIATGPGAELVFVRGRDAALVRADSRVELSGGRAASVFRIVTGAILSVFASGARRRLETKAATIGIRGTAVYVAVEPERTYVCTCYGVADLASRDDPSARETVRTKHHDQPRWIMAQGAPRMIMGAPVVDHTDAELTMLEALVGRRPPFTTRKDYKPGTY